jgi:hypothetical protein
MTGDGHGLTGAQSKWLNKPAVFFGYSGKFVDTK